MKGKERKGREMKGNGRRGKERKGKEKEEKWATKGDARVSGRVKERSGTRMYQQCEWKGEESKK